MTKRLMKITLAPLFVASMGITAPVHAGWWPWEKPKLRELVWGKLEEHFKMQPADYALKMAEQCKKNHPKLTLKECLAGSERQEVGVPR
jgi:hypothetical protein